MARKRVSAPSFPRPSFPEGLKDDRDLQKQAPKTSSRQSGTSSGLKLSPALLHLRYPPKRTWTLGDTPNNLTSLYLRDDEVGGDALFVSLYWTRFTQSNDPVELLETIVKAHDVGIFPPIGALEALARTFRRYLNKKGEESLDDLFGLKKGKGASWAEERYLKLRNDFLVIQIHLLKELFDLTTQEAAKMVAAKLQCKPKEHTYWCNVKEPLSIVSLTDLYGRRRKFGLKHDTWIENYVATWPRQSKLETLHKFPRKSWPLRLREGTS